MSVAGMMTALKATAYKNLQLNAGVFLVGADIYAEDASEMRESVMNIIDWYVYGNEGTATEYEDGKIISIYDSNCILGVTRGGGTFVVNSEMRQAEVDGVRYRFKGDTFVDNVDAQLTTTAIEVFPGNIKRFLVSADIEHTSGSYKWRISQRTRINKVTDYIRHLWWVGDLADGRLMAVHFNCAINTAGLSMTFTDKGEATIPVEFHAVQASVEDYDNAPFEVYIFDKEPVVSEIRALVDGSEETLYPNFNPQTAEYTMLLEQGVGATLVLEVTASETVTFRLYDETSELTIDPACIEDNTLTFGLTRSYTEAGMTGFIAPFTLAVEADGVRYTFRVLRRS